MVDSSAKEDNDLEFLKTQSFTDLDLEDAHNIYPKAVGSPKKEANARRKESQNIKGSRFGGPSKATTQMSYTQS
jgi:hypothetical protein